MQWRLHHLSMLLRERNLGDGLVGLVVFSAITNAGKPLVARMLCRTITKPRSQRYPHLDHRAKMTATCARFASLLLRRKCLYSAVHYKRCATTSIAWSAVERVLVCRTRCYVLWCRGTTSAVMSWSLDAGYRASNPRPFGTHDTKFHSDPLSSCTSRSVPACCAASRLSQTHKPEHHRLRRQDHVDPDVEPEKLKTVKNYTFGTARFLRLRFQPSCTRTVSQPMSFAS